MSLQGCEKFQSFLIGKVAILHFLLNLNPFFPPSVCQSRFSKQCLTYVLYGINFLKYVFVLHFEVFEEIFFFFLTLLSVLPKDQGLVISIFRAVMGAQLFIDLLALQFFHQPEACSKSTLSLCLEQVNICLIFPTTNCEA